MSYQRPGTEQRTSGLSIAALVFAILLPVVGFILGLVARVQAKRTGSPTAIATIAVAVGAVLSVIWTVCIALVLWGGLTLYYTEETSSGEPVEISVPDSAKSVVVELTAQGDLDAETLAAAQAVIERHATQAGMDVLAVTPAEGDSLVAAFDENTPDALIAEFGESLAAPAAIGFAQVFAVLPGTGGQLDGSDETTPSCAELPFGSMVWNEFTLICDGDDTTQYVFDAEPRLPGTAIEEVTLSGDVVAVTLSADAAQPFEEWTAELAAQADPGQIAIIDVNGVMSAPVVQGALSGGEFQISGGATVDNEQIAGRLRVMSAGISFRVDGAKVG